MNRDDTSLPKFVIQENNLVDLAQVFKWVLFLSEFQCLNAKRAKGT